jgi:hypothetical protein
VRDFFAALTGAAKSWLEIVDNVYGYNTVSDVKTETSLKKLPQKTVIFFPDFFPMCCPCPFLQLDGVSLCLDDVLLSKIAI